RGVQKATSTDPSVVSYRNVAPSRPASLPSPMKRTISREPRSSRPPYGMLLGEEEDEHPRDDDDHRGGHEVVPPGGPDGDARRAHQVVDGRRARLAHRRKSYRPAPATT